MASDKLNNKDVPNLGEGVDFSHALNKTFLADSISDQELLLSIDKHLLDKDPRFVSEQELLRSKPTLDQLTLLKNIDTSGFSELVDRRELLNHIDKHLLDKDPRFVSDQELLRTKEILKQSGLSDGIDISGAIKNLSSQNLISENLLKDLPKETPVQNKKSDFKLK